MIIGVSGYISQPHFLNADKKFVNSYYGLKPDENLHDFILNFEPVNNFIKILFEILMF
jgi:hypothetical protein